LNPRASDHPPRVSAVTTTYNGAAYLRETLDSILGQTFRDFEYIIIDDGSADETIALIEGDDDPRIVFVRNPRNLGISGSRNLAFRQARGQYIVTTDQDDVSEPDCIERQVRLLEDNPDISAVASRVNLLIDGKREDDPMPSQSDPVLIHFALYLGRHNTTYSSLCLRRQFVVDHDLYFRPQYHYAEDFELFSRIVEHGRFAIIQEPLVSYRVHASANSKVHYDEMARNGMSFMRDCYSRLFDRPIEEPEAWRIWNGLVEKHPASSREELRDLGRLMTELIAQFTTRHASGAGQAEQIRVLAAQIWHEIVDRSVSAQGLGADGVRAEFGVSQAWSPTWQARLKTRLTGAIGSLRGRRLSN
jgi:glycosyltransferase involved in cell wall biosynthesis